MLEESVIKPLIKFAKDSKELYTKAQEGAPDNAGEWSRSFLSPVRPSLRAGRPESMPNLPTSPPSPQST